MRTTKVKGENCIACPENSSQKDNASDASATATPECRMTNCSMWFVYFENKEQPQCAGTVGRVGKEFAEKVARSVVDTHHKREVIL
jgi:hypothetical protein